MEERRGRVVGACACGGKRGKEEGVVAVVVVVVVLGRREEEWKGELRVRMSVDTERRRTHRLFYVCRRRTDRMREGKERSSVDFPFKKS